MSKLGISTGSSPNDGTGDTLLQGAVKINSNFDEVYTFLGNGSALTTITNSKLTNSSVSFGGVSVTLGSSDATPAFDLSDATNYPTSSLTGTITNAQLSGSIADGKLASTFLKNVVEDTTPQLGGNLNLNSKNITGTGNIPAANLTGTLPSIDGSSLTGIVTSIVAGSNITLTGGPTGIVTITSSGGGSFNGGTVANNTIFSGIATFNQGLNADSFSLKDRNFDILESTSNGVTLQQTGAGKLILRSAGDVEIQSYQGSSLLKTNTLSGTTGGLSLYYATGLTSEVVRLTTTSTGATINGALSVSSSVQVGSGQSFGSSTGSAAVYYGDGSNITSGKWTLGANGSSHYTFTGPGGLSATDDPVIYLARGQTYEFVNNSGGSHPFQIRASNGGSAYSTGVTNNGASSGTIKFEVPFSAPNTLYYQCTAHAGMGGTVVVYPDLFTV